MSEVEPAAALNEKRLTWQQVCEKYPNQWVVLVDVEWVDDMYSEFRTAMVAGHGPRSDDSLDQAEPLRSRFPDQAHLYTGPYRALRPVYV